jgi:hypothetical protein
MMNSVVTEFQVLECFDPDKNKIWKVELEYRQVVIDNGMYMYTSPWKKVHRTRVNMIEGTN